MCKKALQMLRMIQTQKKNDPEYAQLENQRLEAEQEFLAALRVMDPRHREAVLQYLGILQEQGMRELELACFLCEEEK